MLDAVAVLGLDAAAVLGLDAAAVLGLDAAALVAARVDLDAAAAAAEAGTPTLLLRTATVVKTLPRHY